MDRTLDKATKGPLWLKDARVARCVAEAFQYGEREARLHDLFAFAVVANHVHILIQPKAALSKITKAIKGFTSRQANRILERTGQPFWQDESFDYWIRNKDELNRTIRYIERNPVSAGLAQHVEDYPWSSAYQQ
jgi:REP element-mobilizing transposase RayT